MQGSSSKSLSCRLSRCRRYVVRLPRYTVTGRQLLWRSPFSVTCARAVARGVCRTLTAVCIRQHSGHAFRI